jgi:putative addiction module CopG family antidote
MNIQLTDDQRAFVLQAIEAGRFANEGDAVREALLLWEQRERRRAEILASVDQAEASLSRGEELRVSNRQGVVDLASRIKARGLSKLDQGRRNRG